MSDSTEIPIFHNRSSSNDIDIVTETSLIASTNHIIDFTSAGDSFIYSPPF